MRNRFNDDEYIEVIGAKENNLKNIDVKIPRNKLVVITGISGSGKSSLAFDTIYAEGQRRYMETFSSYARQFLGKMDRPEVEKVDGLSPVISIEQKTTAWNPRSTVGTTTEIYDFMRLLYARIGEAYSYVTGKRMVKYSEEQIIQHILDNLEGNKVTILAPLVRARKGHYRELFEQIRKKGYTKARVNGIIIDLEPGFQLDRYKTHDIEVVIDRIKVQAEKRERLAASIETALGMGNDFIMVLDQETEELKVYSKLLMDAESGVSYEEPSPNTFSFNSPYGTCPSCKGLGKLHKVDMDKVIPDDSSTINDVGIKPFGEVRENLTFKQLRAIAKKNKFTFSTPIKEIPQKALDTILHGGDDSYNMSLRYAKHDFTYDLAYEGIVNMLERWYRESTSEKIRQWAEEFMTIVTCPDCDGYRLRKESLNFKVADHHIGELSEMDLEDLYSWFDGIEERLTKKQNAIAKDIIKEIRLRLGFLWKSG